MDSFFLGIIILLLSGFVAVRFSDKFKTFILSILTVIASAFCFIPSVNVLFGGDSLVKTFDFNPLIGVVNFCIDPLSAFFVTLISVMSLLTVIYSNGYLKPYIENGKNINAHLIFLPILIASMMMVVTCQNAFMFLIAWEIMSLSSFFLVIFENEKKEVLKSGIKYLVFMHISVLFIIIAFAMLSLKSGSFDFNAFKYILADNAHFANLIFALLFIGFGTKSGFVPLHNWLPDAHPSAPTHVSAVMSGVMIKTGIYGILRTVELIGTPSKLISIVVLVVSLITALYGVLYAIGQTDIKRLLAYSSIENIGIIGLGIGVGMFGLAYNEPIVALIGFSGGILHILNHSIFKELLFMAAGSVYKKTHTRNIEILGGLIKSMPKTALLFLTGSVAICGLPPFNGFISEFLIYFGMFKGLSVNNFSSIILLLFAISGLALVGTMALLCFSKVFGVVFLGMSRSSSAQKVIKDNEYSMIIPMIIAAAGALLIGILPILAFNIILNPVNLFVKINVYNLLPVLSVVGTVTLYTLAFLLFLLILVFVKLKFTNGKIDLYETWGCGYNKANNHMQYTASSYVSPFLSMLNPLFKKVFDVERPKKLFPHSAHFKLHFEDIEEAYIIKPILEFDEWFLSKFEGLQSGNLQSYIKYGLIFLVLVLIWSLAL